MGNHSFNYLLEVLRERDIPYDRETLKTAYDDPKSHTAIQDWIDEYLSPQTLLTKEEAVLYATLVKNGEVDALTAANDLSAIRGLEDHEVRDAVEELKRSTAAIEKQTESLRLQQNAMSTLIKNKKKNHQARAQTDSSQRRKWNTEMGHISAAVEELSQSLRYQTSDLTQQSKAAEISVKQNVENILKSDDKLLHSLQKLASNLDPRSDDDVLVDRIRELCARLIKYTVEGIRTKLDRIYLDALNHCESSTAKHETQEVFDLQEELESLYSEILPVAQMSTEQQYLEPALREISARNGQGQERSLKAVKYINDSLTFLIDRIGLFLERAEEYQAHNMALQYVLDEAEHELALGGQAEARPSSHSKSSPQKRRTSMGSALRRKGRRSSGLQEEETEAEEQLLRNLGIYLPPELTSDEACTDALEKALSDRTSKLEGHGSSLQSTTESSISSHLLEAHIMLQQLRGSLLTGSPYNNVYLLDQSIESDVVDFETDLKAMQEELEVVNLQKLTTRNIHKEQFVERWSR